MEKIEQFLEALKSGGEAEELLKDRPASTGMEEETRAYAEAAARLGYDISADELKAYAEKKAAACRDRTGRAAEEIRGLSEEEMADVAGGGDTCKNTYKNRENCWKNDGCDNIVNMYDHYLCKWFYYLRCEVAKHG